MFYPKFFLHLVILNSKHLIKQVLFYLVSRILISFCFSFSFFFQKKREIRDKIRSKVKDLPNEEIERILSGFKWLGLFSDTNVERKSNLLDTLCATLEGKLKYAENERDMVILQHKFEIEWKNGEKVNFKIFYIYDDQKNILI